MDANSEAVGPNGMVGVKGHTQGRDSRTALGNVSYMELVCNVLVGLGLQARPYFEPCPL